MALTFRTETSQRLRNRSLVRGLFDFDSSYPEGGESLNNFPHALIYSFQARKEGYEFQFDYAAQKVKVLQAANVPAFVYEEAVTVTTNVGSLAYKPGFILYIAVADGASFDIVSAGVVPGTGECAVDFANNTLTFAAADSVSAVVVTYLPLNSNPILKANLVEGAIVDDAAFPDVTRAAEVITIAGMAAMIQTVDVDGAMFKPIINDDTPGTGEYKITFDSSGDTVLTGSGTEFSGATSIKITYVKHDPRFTYVRDTSAHSADVVTITNPVYMARTGVYIYTDDNDVPHKITDSTETLAANELKVTDFSLKWPEAGGSTLTYEAATDPAASGFDYIKYNERLAYILGVPVEVEPGTSLAGLKDVEFVALVERS